MTWKEGNCIFIGNISYIHWLSAFFINICNWFHPVHLFLFEYSLQIFNTDSFIGIHRKRPGSDIRKLKAVKNSKGMSVLYLNEKNQIATFQKEPLHKEHTRGWPNFKKLDLIILNEVDSPKTVENSPKISLIQM